MHCSTVQFSVVQGISVQCRAVWYNEVYCWCRTVWWSLALEGASGGAAVIIRRPVEFTAGLLYSTGGLLYSTGGLLYSTGGLLYSSTGSTVL